MRERVTSVLEVASAAAIVAAAWGAFGWTAGLAVFGVLGLASSWLVNR